MEAAQGYVMLSRIQALSQLIILVTVSANKLYASDLAKQELDRMTKVALNNKTTWNSIVSCNIRSLASNFKDLISTPKLKDTDVICLQETWMNSDTLWMVLRLMVLRSILTVLVEVKELQHITNLGMNLSWT